MQKHFIKKIAIIAVWLLFGTYNLFAQQLHTRWDEITASEWPKALKASNETCILPIGILEKHGPHVPVGSDLIQVREWSARATRKEYAVVFPNFCLCTAFFTCKHSMSNELFIKNTNRG